MRVVAGYLGGRNFDAPKGHRTHPMGDKIRGALFNALGDIEDLTVFDPFAGSGAVAIEAVSRAAARAVAIDITKEAEFTMRLNMKALDIEERVEVIRADVTSWSNRHPNTVFDIVIMDPPFDAIQYKLIEKLPKHVADHGILVLNWPVDNRIRLPLFQGFSIVSHKTYGDAQLVFYKRV